MADQILCLKGAASQSVEEKEGMRGAETSCGWTEELQRPSKRWERIMLNYEYAKLH